MGVDAAKGRRLLDEWIAAESDIDETVPWTAELSFAAYVAREALRDWLWENKSELIAALEAASTPASPPSKEPIND